MQRRDFIRTAAGLTALAALPKAALAAQTQTKETTTMTTTRPQSGYAPVNGIELYYEIHGQGEPLVLLHGAFGAIEMFGANLATLAANRQVIGVDLQGHGRTLPFDRPMTFEAMATDVAELIKWLGYDKADVMGYSMGGVTALRVGIDHPEAVSRLILTSTTYSFTGWHDYNQQGMKTMAANPTAAVEGMKQTPMYAQYMTLMPDAAKNWPKTIAQTGALVAREFDWSADVTTLKMPTMLVVGDWDAVRTAHVAAFFELLGGGKQDANWDGSGMNKNRLAVLPGATHYTIFADPRLATTAAGFLDA
ncbi:MAG TPA: alpha/beta hydrolase [Devosia sp.]|nr:alpha/beta hydrolase [Devosia sp.]